MKLIKQMNSELKESQQEDQIKSKFKYLDINSVRGINDILEAKKDLGKFGSQDKDVEKLADQYLEKMKAGELKGMSNQDIKDMIGDDLEMLEYEPFQTDNLITRIWKLIK